MNLILDGRPLEETCSAQDTLQQLASRVREKHLGARMVVSIAYDGRTLLEDELGAKLCEPIGGVERIDLVSADPGALVASAFREVATQMATAGREYLALADEVQTGETSKALAHLADYLQVWQSCQKSILEGSGMLATDLTALECGGRTVRMHLDELSARLRELREAFQAGDMVMLSDLFRYELPRTCETWEGVMNELAGQIERVHA
jgi:hypothetical protein